MATFVSRDGNILDDDADALVNPINTRGVMGDGLAAQFRQRWPDMFDDYQWDCDHGLIEVGRLHLYRDDHSPLLIGLPTKDDWRKPSRLLFVTLGLHELRRILLNRDDVDTIAIPALGCGLGGLDWRAVEPAIRGVLGDVGIEVRLYPPKQHG